MCRCFASFPRRRRQPFASAGDGYSSGDAIRAISEVASTTLPSGYTYEFSGLTRSEQQSSNSTMLIFALCLMFVYLILSAQYESYLLPLSVILSIPFGLAGAFLFTNLFGKQNDIYMQISLIMLIGLLAKNAIHDFRVDFYCVKISF